MLGEMLVALSLATTPGQCATCGPSGGVSGASYGGSYGSPYGGAYGGGGMMVGSGAVTGSWSSGVSPGVSPYDAVSNGGGGGRDQLYPFDSQEQWLRGYFQEIPAYGGYSTFRPHNYKHVLAQMELAQRWGINPTMPYSHQWYHQYRQRSGMHPNIGMQQTGLNSSSFGTIAQYSGDPASGIQTAAGSTSSGARQAPWAALQQTAAEERASRTRASGNMTSAPYQQPADVSVYGIPAPPNGQRYEELPAPNGYPAPAMINAPQTLPYDRYQGVPASGYGVSGAEVGTYSGVPSPAESSLMIPGFSMNGTAPQQSSEPPYGGQNYSGYGSGGNGAPVMQGSWQSATPRSNGPIFHADQAGVMQRAPQSYSVPQNYSVPQSDSGPQNYSAPQSTPQAFQIPTATRSANAPVFGGQSAPSPRVPAQGTRSSVLPASIPAGQRDRIQPVSTSSSFRGMTRSVSSK